MGSIPVKISVAAVLLFLLDLPSESTSKNFYPSYRTLFTPNGEPHFGEFEVPRPVPLVFTDFDEEFPIEPNSRSSLPPLLGESDEIADSTEVQNPDRLRSVNAAVTKGSKGQPIIIVYGGKAKRKYRGGGKGKKKRGQQEYLPIHHYHHGNNKNVPHHYDPWGHVYNPKQPPPAVLHHIMKQKYQKTHDLWFPKKPKIHRVHASSHSGTFSSHYWDNLFRRLAKNVGILGVADYDNHYGKHGTNPLTKNKISYHSGFYTEII